jgi:hypothetical protein
VDIHTYIPVCVKLLDLSKRSVDDTLPEVAYISLQVLLVEHIKETARTLTGVHVILSVLCLEIIKYKVGTCSYCLMLRMLLDGT